MVYYFLAIAVIALDQITKYFVVRYMDIGESIPLINNVLYLTSHRNAGAAFGILQGQMWLFFIATIIVVSIIIYLMITQIQGSKWFGTSLGLVLGGAIGNFIDRVLAGEVVDFIDVFIFTYNYPIFNVADMALVIGVGMMMIHFIKEDRKEKKQGK